MLTCKSENYITVTVSVKGYYAVNCESWSNPVGVAASTTFVTAGRPLNDLPAPCLDSQTYSSIRQDRIQVSSE